MIYNVTFQAMPEQMNVSLIGVTAEYINPWVGIQEMMEGTGDHLIWIITKLQKQKFLDMMKKYDLEKYLVVDHSKDPSGTTNRNYPEDPRRLKVFIMKGVK